MRRWAVWVVVVAGCLAAACTPGSLRNRWLIGLQATGPADPRQQALAERWLASLAALPNLMVVDLRMPRNAHDFDSLADRKIRLVIASMEDGPLCLRASYGVFRAGRLQYTSGLMIPRDNDAAVVGCSDLLATRLYSDLRRQGL